MYTTEQNYFSLKEAAEHLRLPISTFRHYVQTKRVSGSKVGKRWVFSKNDLDSFVVKNRRAAK